MVDETNQTQGVTEVINQLYNIAQQLSAQSKSITNAEPAATTTNSPKFTGVNLTNATATVIIAAATSTPMRHGLVLHNPSTTIAYVWPTVTSPVPTTASLAGSMQILAGSSVIWNSPQFPNINVGFSGVSSSGTTQPFTAIEFF